MPFSSKSQRRKFHALKAEGKMDQKTIDEWEKDTPEKLPEKVAMNKQRFFNIFMDAQNQVLQEDPEYKRIRKTIRKKIMKKEAFWNGFEKKANWKKHIGDVAEVAGLGTLMVPSIQHLRGKPMKQDTTHKLEVAGLGTLMAPYLYKGVKALKHVK